MELVKPKKYREVFLSGVLDTIFKAVCLAKKGKFSFALKATSQTCFGKCFWVD
jgi:hypothetical protein